MTLSIAAAAFARAQSSGRRRRPEDDLVRAQLVPFYASLGFDCYPTSARVHAKGVAPGIPDLYVINVRYRFAFWHEAKRPTTERGWSRQSQAQLLFQERVKEHTAYVLGDLESAYDFAKWLDLGERLANGFHRFRRDQQIFVPAKVHGWNTSAPALAHYATWGWKP